MKRIRISDKADKAKVDKADKADQPEDYKAILIIKIKELAAMLQHERVADPAQLEGWQIPGGDQAGRTRYRMEIS